MTKYSALSGAHSNSSISLFFIVFTFYLLMNLRIIRKLNTEQNFIVMIFINLY